MQQFASEEGALRGAGKTMLGWVKTPGFLEQVCRNMEIRRRIRRVMAFWRTHVEVQQGAHVVLAGTAARAAHTRWNHSRCF